MAFKVEIFIVLASTQEEDAVQCVALLQAAQVKNIKWLIVTITARYCMGETNFRGS